LPTGHEPPPEKVITAYLKHVNLSKSGRDYESFGKPRKIRKNDNVLLSEFSKFFQIKLRQTIFGKRSFYLIIYRFLDMPSTRLDNPPCVNEPIHQEPLRRIFWLAKLLGLNTRKN
jgi:hypothetical protein